VSRTYFMIKPEAVRAGVFADILKCAIANRFTVERLEMRTFSRDLARRFYAEHEGKGFFEDLVAYMTGGPVVAVQLAGDNAVERLRLLVGKTNPADAAPGTIRAMFGRSLQENAVHASDSEASATRELGLVFPSH
jgi:nucleoside-diphosphate kinase